MIAAEGSRILLWKHLIVFLILHLNFHYAALIRLFLILYINNAVHSI